MNCKFPPRRLYIIPLPRGASLQLGERCLIMGILNVTPDSFAERGPLTDVGTAVDVALSLEAEGADIIDIGGESTKPGARPVSADEETARVMPVVRALAGRLRVPMSVDTSKAAVARAALAEGAVLVNDISGLRYDPELAAAVAEADAALVLMHMRGRPDDMYDGAHYENMMADVIRELGESIALATGGGVSRDRLVVDPGIGFAKRASDSYGVLARLPELAAALDRPVLAGPSRKSFMREALDGRAALERDWGTAAAVTAAVLGGAHIVRVHAVAEMAQVVKVADGIRNAWTD